MRTRDYLDSVAKVGKEEVLVHDGSKIIVERTVERGGRHEIGQQPPIKEQSLIFSLPTTDERVTWKSVYSENVGLADFKPILLDIVQGTAYVVSAPVGCLSYNKWGQAQSTLCDLQISKQGMATDRTASTAC